MNAANNHPQVHCVIGSGPAGIAGAQALLERGVKVLMLDAGLTLESSRRELVAQMASQRPQAWSAEQLKNFKAGMASSAKGIPLKLAYGSDYPYREADVHLPADYDGVALRPSLGLGGFSSVWGSAMMPYSAKDMVGWPIGPADLAEHYSAVAKLTGFAGVHDDLEKIFPLHTEPRAALNLSRQAKILHDRLNKNRDALSQAGIYFGQSRVAVKAGENGCVYCGLCMYGCPYGFIYNSEQTLRTLLQNPNFSYRGDSVVTRVRENGETVFITGHQRANREPFEISANRVYLGAGVVSTTGIVLRSLSLYDRAVRLKDSQYYLFPLLLAKSGGDVQREALHTLSQMFVEIFDDAITPRSIHLQVYSYNDLVGQAVRQSFGPAAGAMGWMANALEKRLLIVQGYLHSDHSSQISVRLQKDERLKLQAELNSEVRPTIRRVLRKVFRHARQFGAWPLAPMLQIAEPGRGFHNGSSFPMRENPGELETDKFGRLRGWRRIHLVDASVLPDVPATQITFSVMANAHRIGSQSEEEMETSNIQHPTSNIQNAKPLCAITGSNGYVGNCVKNYFAASGWEILELVRQPKPGARAAKFQLGEEISPSALAGVDALVHCAYDFKPLTWEEIRSVNIAGAEKLFQAARAAGVKKIICISSISAYDECRSLYGKAKLEIEKVARGFGAQVIRPGLVYGRGPGGMFGKLTQQVQKSSITPLIGDGSQIQFLVHNEDLCAFIEKVAAEKTGTLPTVLTAANPEPWPFKKLLLEIAKVQNKKLKFIPLPWRLVWLGLKSAETCGLRLDFRSDNLVSLMYQNRSPDFSANASVGLICRRFEIETLK